MSVNQIVIIQFQQLIAMMLEQIKAMVNYNSKSIII